MTGLEADLAHALPAARVLAETSIGVTLADARDPDLPLVYVNGAFERLTGYRAVEVLGRNCRLLQGPRTDPHARLRLRRAIAAQRPCRTTLLNYRKDGSTFWNELVITPIHDDHGALTHFAGVMLDVSHTVAEVRRLRDEREALTLELTELRALRDVLRPADVPRIAGFDVAKVILGAEIAAGDFYLVAPSVRASVVVAVGDAAGHGLGAAQPASFVRASLATFASMTDAPDRLLEMANTSLIERARQGDQFVTCACLSIRADGTVHAASAGHPPPLALDTGEPLVRQTAPPLGVTLGPRIVSDTSYLGPGDGVLLYTDGLTEARLDQDPGRIGEDRVRQRLRELRGRPVADVLRALALLAPSLRAARPADDVCMVAVRRHRT
jgi:phosphoserine phosphatase RsbU/P